MCADAIVKTAFYNDFSAYDIIEENAERYYYQLLEYFPQTWWEPEWWEPIMHDISYFTTLEDAENAAVKAIVTALEGEY